MTYVEFYTKEEGVYRKLDPAGQAIAFVGYVKQIRVVNRQPLQLGWMVFEEATGQYVVSLSEEPITVKLTTPDGTPVTEMQVVPGETVDLPNQELTRYIVRTVNEKVNNISIAMGSSDSSVLE